jgi:membrane-bound lytic murein transglycosylase D
MAHEDVSIGEPPAVPPDLYVKEQPNFLPAAITAPRSSQVDNRLRRAEDRFQAGQRAYQQGRIDEARQEFNRAVDILLSTPENAWERQRAERRLELMVEAIYRFDVNGMGSGEDADKVVFDKSPLDSILEMTFPVDPGLKSKVKEEVTATSSQLPLEVTDAVLSYINFFSSERGRRMLSHGMKRSGKYRPMIQRVLAEEGVPQEMIYLAQIESAFSPRAISRKRCVGLWQFSAWDGKNRGLDQNNLVDERMDPEKSTRAAAIHLRELYKQFGDWYLAMAAYNCGPGCVDRAVQRTGYADFWKLRDMKAIPKETTNYVPVIVAITIMVKNARDYGLENIEYEPALEYESVKVEAPTNLGLIADATERPISEIRDMNPSILKGIAPAGHEVRVPKGTSEPLMAALEAVPFNRRANWRMHRVEQGETLAAIAKKFNTQAGAILAANKSGDALGAGEVLIIPATYQEKAPAFKARVNAGSKSSAKRRTAGRNSSTTRKAAYSKRVPARVLNKKAAVRTASR